MENKEPTQNQMILDYLMEHDSITSLEAQMEFGVMRLASRISDLRKRGHVISSKRVTVLNRNGKKCRVARYKLESEGKQ